MQLSRQQRAALNAVAVNRAYMMRTGLTYSGHRLWTATEIETLRRLHPDYRALDAALAGRTRYAIQHKARRIGLALSRRVWSEAEFYAMKPPYVQGAPMQDILDRCPGKTARQVWAKAARCGIRRPRRPLQPIGIGPVDAVRRRAFELRMSMGDLDEIAGSRSYFRRPQRLDWSALQRVLPSLGGHIVVSWHGD